MKTKTQKIVLCALLASLTCVATMIIKIPSPLKGYLNLGDSVVLLTGWIISPLYSFLSAGIGSALADVFSGYILYAPVTFIIKGAMAVAAYFIFKLLKKNFSLGFSRVVSGILAEIIMVCGYFVFEGAMYGFKASAVNIPANAVQGIVGIILGIVLVKIFEKSNIYQ